MPDLSLLGYDADPNAAVAGNSDGEFLLVNSPNGTAYQQSDGTLWDKIAQPNTWVIRGSGAVSSVTLQTAYNNSAGTDPSILTTDGFGAVSIRHSGVGTKPSLQVQDSLGASVWEINYLGALKRNWDEVYDTESIANQNVSRMEMNATSGLKRANDDVVNFGGTATGITATAWNRSVTVENGTTLGLTALEGDRFTVFHRGVTLAASIIGSQYLTGTRSSSATATEVIGIRNQIRANGDITTSKGIFLPTPNKGGSATIGTNIGLNIEDHTEGTLNYSIRTGGGQVRFGDHVGIGTDPTSQLHVLGLNTQTLTGTMDLVALSPTVTGTGTLFLTEVTPGASINIGGTQYEVILVTSDTSLDVSPTPTNSFLGLTATVTPDLFKVETPAGRQAIETFSDAITKMHMPTSTVSVLSSQGTNVQLNQLGPRAQYIETTANIDVNLPDTSTWVAGDSRDDYNYLVKNTGTFTITIKDFGGTEINTLGPNNSAEIRWTGTEWEELLFSAGSENQFNFLGSSTGVIAGGVISATPGGTTFDISYGNGQVVDNTDPNNPVITPVSWTGLTGEALPDIVTNPATYIAIDSAGLIQRSPTAFTASQRRSLIVIGVVVHSTTVVDLVQTIPQALLTQEQQSLIDFAGAIGPINTDGNVFGQNGANLTITKTAGKFYQYGSNYATSLIDPHNIASPDMTPVTFVTTWRDGAGGFNNSAPTTTINPNLYDNNGGGVGSPVDVMPNKDWQIMRIYMSVSGIVVIHYGQAVYNSQAEAIGSINTEVFAENPELSGTSLRGWLVVEEGTIDLSNTAEAIFIEAGPISGIGSTATPISVNTLQGAYNISGTDEIEVNSTNGALTVKDNLVTINDNLLEVKDSAGTSELFNVHSDKTTFMELQRLSNAQFLAQATNLTVGVEITKSINYIDPTAQIDVNLPNTAGYTAQQNDLNYTFKNIGSAGFSLVVKDFGGTTLAAVADGESCNVRYDGNGNWQVFFFESTPLAVDIPSGDLMLSTALWTGGDLSHTVDTQLFTVAAGTGVVVDSSDPENAIVTPVSWGEFTSLNVDTEAGFITDRFPATFVGIDVNGVLQYSVQAFTETQRRSIISLGVVIHPPKASPAVTVISSTQPIVGALNEQLANQVADMAAGLGPLKISGGELSGAAGFRNVTIGAMEVFSYGLNFKNDNTDPHTVDHPEVTPTIWNTTWREDVGQDTPLGFRSVVGNPSTGIGSNGVWDKGRPFNSNTSAPDTSITSGYWANKRLYMTVGATEFISHYPQHEYPTREEALAARETETFEVNPILVGTIFLGWVTYSRSTTDLTDTTGAVFTPSPKLNLGTQIGLPKELLSLQGIYGASGNTPEIILSEDAATPGVISVRDNATPLVGKKMISFTNNANTDEYFNISNNGLTYSKQLIGSTAIHSNVTGTIVFTETEEQVHYVEAASISATVTLPATGSWGAEDIDRNYTFKNTGSSGFDLRIQTSVGGLVANIADAISVSIRWNGTTWEEFFRGSSKKQSLQTSYDESGATDPKVQLSDANGSFSIQDSSSSDTDVPYFEVRDRVGANALSVTTFTGRDIVKTGFYGTGVTNLVNRNTDYEFGGATEGMVNVQAIADIRVEVSDVTAFTNTHRGIEYVIKNTGTGGFTITVTRHDNNGGAELCKLEDGEFAIVKYNGTEWEVFCTVITSPSYTVATLPSANIPGRQIFVSDESGGAVMAFSDGTNWRRTTDRATVS